MIDVRIQPKPYKDCQMQVTKVNTERDPSNYGDAVSNAIFHVARGHWLAERAVEGFAEAFRGNVWASGGPNLVCTVFIRYCDCTSGSGQNSHNIQ